MRARHMALTLVLGLATAALLAGPASAVRPDDKAGMLGVGAVTTQAPATPVRPDDRAGSRGPGSVLQPPTAPSTWIDRQELRTPGRSVETSQSSSIAAGDGFQWGDAAVGGGVFLLLGSLVVALILNGRLERRPI